VLTVDGLGGVDIGAFSHLIVDHPASGDADATTVPPQTFPCCTVA
jgi:hypothetical protein